MLSQIYNQCIEFFPSLDLKPYSESAHQQQVVKAMQGLLRTIKNLMLTEESRSTFETYLDYLSLEQDLGKEALEQAFNEIYVAIIESFGKPKQKVILDPVPAGGCFRAPKWKYNHAVEPVDPGSTLTVQAYQQSIDNQQRYRELFHQYIQLEKHYNEYINSARGKNIENKLPYQPSGSPQVLFSHLLNFAKQVDFTALESFMKGDDNENMEMATGMIQTLPDTAPVSDTYEVLLTYANALKNVLNHVRLDASKNLK